MKGSAKILNKRVRVLWGILGLLAVPSISAGSCGATGCPVDMQSLQRHALGRGLLHLGYEFEYVDQNRPRIGRHRASIGEISGHHDEVRTLSRVHRLNGTYGINERVRLDVSLPYIARSHRHVHNHMGQAIPMGWDFSGLGDLYIQARSTFQRSEGRNGAMLSSIVGVEIPTGKEEVHNSSGDHAEPGITPGSGSWDYVIGGVYEQYPYFLSTTYRFNGKGHEDYEIGNVFQANLGARLPLSGRIALLGQLNTVIRERDGAGHTHEEVEKTGGEFLYFSPGLAIDLTQNIEWTGIVQIPLYQRVNQIQLTSKYNVITGISWNYR